MIKTRLFSGLALATLILAACGSATPATTDIPTPGSASTVVASPLPIATSRGPNLEATDPSMVKLASGGLQLVEFFRFT